MIISHFCRSICLTAMHLVSLCYCLADSALKVASLLSCALYHGVLLAGVLKAGGRPGDGPAVGAWDRSLDVPLHEVEQWVPPGVGEVVVGRAFQSLSGK